MQAPDEAGEILGGDGGVDGAPTGMAESAGEDGPEGVVAVAGMADAEQEVHGEEVRMQRSENWMNGCRIQKTAAAGAAAGRRATPVINRP